MYYRVWKNTPPARFATKSRRIFASICSVIPIVFIVWLVIRNPISFTFVIVWYVGLQNLKRKILFSVLLNGRMYDWWMRIVVNVLMPSSQWIRALSDINFTVNLIRDLINILTFIHLIIILRSYRFPRDYHIPTNLGFPVSCRNTATPLMRR